MNYINTEKKYFMGVFKRYPVCFVKGKGKYLWDNNGKRYLDFFSGIAVTSLGHCHPAVTKAIQTQAATLAHTSNHFYTTPQLHLAQLLVEKFPKSHVFFSNSGAEANECAIKFARKWGTSQHPKKYEIITFFDSFHGRTIATLSATAQPNMHKGFAPLLPGFRYVPFNDVHALTAAVSSKTCAILVEPILGEGGIQIATQAFMNTMVKLCKKHNALLISDEIQTGLGRTGTMFGFEHYGITPDIITLAKSLGGGIPIGATLVNDTYANVFGYGSHGSTFGGNCIACSAGVAVMKQLTPSRLAHITTVGAYFLSSLKTLATEFDWIKQVRGKGLMCALDLALPSGTGRTIVEACLMHGLVINVTHDTVLRFLPPYIITKNDVDIAIKILRTVCRTLDATRCNQ